MAVQKTALPSSSALWRWVGSGDFVDCYAVEARPGPRRAAEEMVQFPGWVQALLRLRAIVTAPFGLDQDGPDMPDKLGPFPVIHEDADEVIAGFDDKHLNFCVAIYQSGEQIHLATWVHTHNLGGRIYLTLILPFHIMIARNAVARIGRLSA